MNLHCGVCSKIIFITFEGVVRIYVKISLVLNWSDYLIEVKISIFWQSPMLNRIYKINFIIIENHGEMVKHRFWSKFMGFFQVQIISKLVDIRNSLLNLSLVSKICKYTYVFKESFWNLSPSFWTNKTSIKSISEWTLYFSTLKIKLRIQIDFFKDINSNLEKFKKLEITDGLVSARLRYRLWKNCAKVSLHSKILK